MNDEAQELEMEDKEDDNRSDDDHKAISDNEVERENECFSIGENTGNTNSMQTAPNTTTNTNIHEINASMSFNSGYASSSNHEHTYNLEQQRQMDGQIDALLSFQCPPLPRPELPLPDLSLNQSEQHVQQAHPYALSMRMAQPQSHRAQYPVQQQQEAHQSHMAGTQIAQSPPQTEAVLMNVSTSKPFRWNEARRNVAFKELITRKVLVALPFYRKPMATDALLSLSQTDSAFRNCSEDKLLDELYKFQRKLAKLNADGQIEPHRLNAYEKSLHAHLEQTGVYTAQVSLSHGDSTQKQEEKRKAMKEKRFKIAEEMKAEKGKKEKLKQEREQQKMEYFKTGAAKNTSWQQLGQQRMTTQASEIKGQLLGKINRIWSADKRQTIMTKDGQFVRKSELVGKILSMSSSYSDWYERLVTLNSGLASTGTFDMLEMCLENMNWQ